MDSFAFLFFFLFLQFSQLVCQLNLLSYALRSFLVNLNKFYLFLLGCCKGSSFPIETCHNSFILNFLRLSFYIRTLMCQIIYLCLHGQNSPFFYSYRNITKLKLFQKNLLLIAYWCPLTSYYGLILSSCPNMRFFRTKIARAITLSLDCNMLRGLIINRRSINSSHGDSIDGVLRRLGNKVKSEIVIKRTIVLHVDVLCQFVCYVFIVEFGSSFVEDEIYGLIYRRSCQAEVHRALLTIK